MVRFKGIIALDIDGTITLAKHALEQQVQGYLTRLIAEGWRLIFITGRTFSFGYPILAGLEGNYFFAPQNGAALYRMPSEELLYKQYIPTTLLEQLDPLFREQGIGLLVEAGRENGDICYYKPEDFAPDLLEYLTFRAKISLGAWQPVTSFQTLPFREFAVAKYFAPEAQAHAMAAQLSRTALLNVIVIRDPFRPGFHLAHMNVPGASKGEILTHFIEMHPKGLPVIAAGDDYNDVEMLKNSSVKIIMRNAPAQMHQLADIIAPPADEQGIIPGLEQGIWKALSK